MSNQKQARWGIVTLGIVMLFVTLLMGNKGSFYAVVWMAISYFGYKGNLLSIKNLMKWIIFLNFIALLVVLLMLDDKTVGYMAYSKEFLAIGVLIMMVPKIILYFYVDDKISKEKHPIISNKTESQYAKKNTAETISKIQKIQSMEDAYSSVKNETLKTPTNMTLKPINEDALWEIAVDEVDGENRKKAMWAKCFAEADGDENKAKASYLKIRVAELKSEKIKEQSTIPSENLSSIVNNNPSEIKQTTVSCPMCHTTNLRIRDDCVSCRYDLRALKRLF